MRVYLLGYFGVGALADDLILAITRWLFQSVDRGVQLLDRSIAPHPHRGREVADFFNQSCDLVVFCGGSLLGRLRLSPFDRLEDWIAGLRVPLAILGTGWREETMPLTLAERERCELLLRRASFVGVRGELSAQKVRGLTDRPVEALGDPGLCYPSIVRPAVPRRHRVGVVVRQMSPLEEQQDRSTPPSAEFHARLASVLDRIAEEESAEVIFCPMTAIDRRIDDDFAACEAVAGKMTCESWPAGVYFSQPRHDARTMAETLGRMDLVVSQRLHGTLVSIAQGVPVLPIEYQFGKLADSLSVPGFEQLRSLIVPAGDLSVDAWLQRRDQLRAPELIAANRAACRAVRDRYRAAIAGLLAGG